MSKLVKTGKEILSEHTDIGIRFGFLTKEDTEFLNKKYLVLPDGLDKLEEMLKEEKCGDMEGFCQCLWTQYSTDNKEVNEIISKIINEVIEHHFIFDSVFARFKKENGI